MRTFLSCVLLLAFASAVRAGERTRQFDWSTMPRNECPTGCVSVIAGAGRPGVWKVIPDMEPIESGLLSLNGHLRMAEKDVVAQLSQDFTGEHYPILLLGSETYEDFTLSTRFKIVSGAVEQMAGLVFRYQDEKNYYYLRVSALGKNIRFYSVSKGVLLHAGGANVDIAPGVWHELSVRCTGNLFECSLDGKLAFPTFNENSFSGGRIGYLTKSDTVSYFADTRITYTVREPFVQGLVRETMTKYPRLLGLQVVMLTGDPALPRLVASDKQQEVGAPGRKSAADVIQNGTVYYDKNGDQVTVTMPLRDRNGDAQAAVRVTMRSFKGQTEENAVLRALPIVKEMQARVPTSNDWKD